MDISCIVLAGGKGLRLGRNKALEAVGSRNLLQQAISNISFLKSAIIIVTAREQSLPQFIDYPGLRVVTDIYPDKGPLGGIYTGLIMSDSFYNLVVACDMPFVNADLLAHQRDVLFSDNMDVVVPSSRKGLEPLHAIFRRETCLPAVREALDAGEQRLISWFPRVRVRVLLPEETNPFDPRGLMFFNVNTPEELAQAEKIAEETIHPKTNNGV